MLRLVEYIINELNYRQIRDKQKDIGKLFGADKFKDRLASINSNGGVRLLGDKTPELWHFSVASGTRTGVNYDVYVEFQNIPQYIADYAKDRSLWKTDGSGVNYSLLAAEIFNNINLKIDCSCPVDTYWGGEYIRTGKDAQYGSPENRPADIRNPRDYGILCKHGHDVWTALPFYTSDFAHHLKMFFKADVDAVEDTIQKEIEAIPKAADWLAKKEKEQASAYTKGAGEVATEEEEEEE